MKDWNLWFEFCKLTKREEYWGNFTTELLTKENLLPCKIALDVGCGDGQFSSIVAKNCERLTGIDLLDSCKSTEKNFTYVKTEFETYDGVKPELIIFKQSAHLLQGVHDILSNKYSYANIVFLQMPRPKWLPSSSWDNKLTHPNYNLTQFKRSGYTTKLSKHTLNLSIDEKFAELMFKIGFTSDLKKLSQEERNSIWSKTKKNIRNGKLAYKDSLWVIIAKPL